MTNGSHIVYVVDDELAVRRATSFILSARQIGSRTFQCGADFLAEVHALEPGCLLLDAHMPGLSGWTVQEALAHRQVDLPTIVMTAQGDVGAAVQGMRLGAIDVLEKPFDDATLFGAVGRAFAILDDRRRCAEQMGEAARLIDALSRRETDVLRGLVAGMPNKVIAHRLGLSPRTVEMHRAKMMAKLGLRSLPNALRLAFRAGLPPLDGQVVGEEATPGRLYQEPGTASARLLFTDAETKMPERGQREDRPAEDRSTERPIVSQDESAAPDRGDQRDPPRIPLPPD